MKRSFRTLSGVSTALCVCLCSSSFLTVRADNVDDVWHTGYSYFKKKDFRQAISYFNKVIELDPKSVKGYGLRCDSYFNLEQYDKCIQDANQAIRLNPGFAPAYMWRGEAYANLGKYDQALNDCQQALKLFQQAGDEANAGYVADDIQLIQLAKAGATKAITIKHQ